MIIKELTKIEEILKNFDVIKYLYPNLSIEKYEEYLRQMLPHNYSQICVYQEDQCVAVCGCWVGVKIWCGRYLELDNVIVHPDFQKSGVGKAITKHLEEKAIKLKCNIMALDAYTSNFKAHRFYYNQGFGPKGFHFVKILDEKGIN